MPLPWFNPWHAKCITVHSWIINSSMLVMVAHTLRNTMSGCPLLAIAPSMVKRSVLQSRIVPASSKVPSFTTFRTTNGCEKT